MIKTRSDTRLTTAWVLLLLLMSPRFAVRLAQSALDEEATTVGLQSAERRKPHLYANAGNHSVLSAYFRQSIAHIFPPLLPSNVP